MTLKTSKGLPKIRGNWGRFLVVNALPWNKGGEDQYQKDYKKKLYWERRKAGVCPVCREPNIARFKLCLECRKIHARNAKVYFDRKKQRANKNTEPKRKNRQLS